MKIAPEQMNSTIFCRFGGIIQREISRKYGPRYCERRCGAGQKDKYAYIMNPGEWDECAQCSMEPKKKER